MAMIVIAAVSAAVTAGEAIYQLLHHKPLQPLQDTQVSSSADGAPIPFGYGKNRFGGQLIWSNGIQYATIQSGGSGGSSQAYLYGADFAVAFGEGPGTILRIWGDSKLIYLAPGASQAMGMIGAYAPWNSTIKYSAGDFVNYVNYLNPAIPTVWECTNPNVNQVPAPSSLYWTSNKGVANWDNTVTYNPGDLVVWWYNVYASVQLNNLNNDPRTNPNWWTHLANYWKPPTIYTGTQTQNPDPLIQGIEGAAFTPGFRPLIYAVWDKLPLANFGNRIPNMRAEINFTKTSNNL